MAYAVVSLSILVISFYNAGDAYSKKLSVVIAVLAFMNVVILSARILWPKQQTFENQQEG